MQIHGTYEILANVWDSSLGHKALLGVLSEADNVKVRQKTEVKRIYMMRAEAATLERDVAKVALANAEKKCKAFAEEMSILEKYTDEELTAVLRSRTEVEMIGALHV